MTGSPQREGRRLRELREAAGLSLRGLALHSGYSAPYLSRVENDERSTTPELLRLYATLPSAADKGVRVRRLPSPAASARSDGPRDLGIIWYGAEVRRMRMADGRSLEALGAEVYLSRAYLGKIEQGHARGTYQIALALDTALRAGGRLAQHFLEECARVGPVPPDTEILADGDAPAISTAEPAGLAAAAALRLQSIRIRSHQVGPASVLRDLSDGVVELHRRASASSPVEARPLWSMALRYAELLGWSAQEIGHDDKAMRWTRMAAEWSRLIGDDEALGYVLTRQSQWARRSGDAEAALGYARAAGALAAASSRIRMFAAQREAQAYALLGEEGPFRSALDRYLALIGEDHDDEPDDPTSPPWGPRPDTAFDNSRIFEATCLVDLGEFNAAATLFAEHSARLNGGRTGYARIGVREAIAYAHIGEPELACEVAFRCLPVVAQQGSASIRGDLNRLARTLNRHRRNPVVRHLLPDLAAFARAAGTFPAATATP